MVHRVVNWSVRSYQWMPEDDRGPEESWGSRTPRGLWKSRRITDTLELFMQPLRNYLPNCITLTQSVAFVVQRVVVCYSWTSSGKDDSRTWTGREGFGRYAEEANWTDDTWTLFCGFVYRGTNQAFMIKEGDCYVVDKPPHDYEFLQHKENVRNMKSLVRPPPSVCPLVIIALSAQKKSPWRR